VIGSIDGAYGIKIVKVTRGSPAANAGLLAGDTVLALDGVKVKSERALDAQFANREAGSKIIATIMHGGWTYDVTITKADKHTFDHSLGFLFPGHTVEINP
jgi:S1-C subfamily serine protease